MLKRWLFRKVRVTNEKIELQICLFTATVEQGKIENRTPTIPDRFHSWASQCTVLLTICQDTERRTCKTNERVRNLEVAAVQVIFPLIIS